MPLWRGPPAAPLRRHRYLASSTTLFGKLRRPARKLTREAEYVQILSDGSDAWRCMDIASILREGGVGVLPTESGYGIVTPLDSRSGLERLLRMKGAERSKKPLSLLCADLPTVDKYCYGINRAVFKILKKNLPGPYTFILPASTALPKMLILDAKGGRHSWARKSLGVRIPSDPVLRYVQDELLEGAPLLVSSLPNDEDDVNPFAVCSLDAGASWCRDVDFMVDAGERPLDGSTIFDLTGAEPILVREGLGDLELS